ncbi:MAG: YacL family protein [Marinobacterium sp.]|nr:YacL family protein [Marinobacterium sp.]
MEYEFSQDIIGRPVARFSMGHEAFGLWLEDELSSSVLVLSLLEKFDGLRGMPFQALSWDGREYSLQLEGDEVSVLANVLMMELSGWDNDEMALSDEGQRAACGQEDFEAMLQQWLQFLRTIGC